MHTSLRAHQALRLFLFLSLFISLTTSGATAAPNPLQNSGGNPVPVDGGQPPSSNVPVAPNVDPNRVGRFIVQLSDAPLATYPGGVSGLAPTAPSRTGASRLDVNAPASQSYLAYLAGKQTAFIQQLSSAVPNAQVERQYQVVLNAMAVKARWGDLAKIHSLAGVTQVQPEREYKIQMDASIPLIGLGTGTLGGTNWADSGLWAALGGHANAGKGIKVADIDSGITPSNPCFSPAGFAYPAGFPKFDPGYDAYVTPKIIAARAFFRPDDPPESAPTPLDDPGSLGGGHGTHTAGTMVCDYGTTTTFSGIKISGIAPMAQLMVYRVFYLSVGGSGSAFSPELDAAIEAAVRDGADVVNNSWGGLVLDMNDLDVQAYSAAVAAGVAVVFSAGNAGPGAMTIGSPGIGESFITAGASTTSRTLLTGVWAVSRSDGGAIPDTVAQGKISGSSVTQTAVTAVTVDLQAAGYADPLACSPLPSTLVSGKIVVIERGTCALVDKVSNAKDGGAVGVILRNVAGGATTLPLINPVLPEVHVSQANGDAIFAFLSGLPAGVTATFTINGPATYTPNGDAGDTIASFSSLGPNPDMTIKPDIAAPGVNILSSVSPAQAGTTTPAFDFFQGTSMAAPHVTGAAALMRQLHPGWSPAQIKSALITTSAEATPLGANPTVRGAGRLNLADVSKVQLTFDRPSLSFGLVAEPGSTPEKVTVTATNTTGAAVTYTLAVSATQGDAPTLSASSMTVPANGTAAFDVSLAGATTGDAFGKIVLTDAAGTGAALHIPYWAREIADLGPAQVLLIDDDKSGASPLPAGCAGTDVRSFYTSALNSLGISFVVWDVATMGPVDFNQARRYSKSIVFTGDHGCAGDMTVLETFRRNYLAQGGKLLVSSQDEAVMETSVFGSNGLMAITFGADAVQNSLYGAGQPPQPTLQGDNTYAAYLAGQIYDISNNGNGAGNQTSVDEIQASFFNDTDALPILNSAPVKTMMSQGTVGSRMSSEPTLERVTGKLPWTRLGYRTEFLSFGLEAVSDNTGFDTRPDLLKRLLDWLDDSVSVQFDKSSYTVGKPNEAVSVSATANASITSTGVTKPFANVVMVYRWDFGDGTPIQTTANRIATHGYKESGVYTIRVEAIDGFGHHAVSNPAQVIVTPKVYLPIVGR